MEYKASGPKGEFVMKKVPGRMKWNNVTLKRGITSEMDMWKWRKLVEQGKVDLAPFITGRIGLDHLIDQGFDTLIHHNETAVKILVSPSGRGL